MNMKISESKVRVDMPKKKSSGDPPLAALKTVKPKTAPPPDELPDFDIDDTPFKVKPAKPKKSAPSFSAEPLRDDYSALRDAAFSVQRIKTTAQQELEQIKRMRADAVRYQQETATRARSEANQLILHARMATQREIEELIRQAGEEIQKMLADIRVIRITAQEELSAQRKFTDAAKLNSLSLSFKEQLKEQMEKTAAKSRRQPVTSK